MPKKRKALTYGYALKSYFGYLEGRSKSDHTIKSYASDLKTFENYLKYKNKKKQIVLERLSLEDLSRYSQWLRAKGYRINSRRRKLLTVRRFFLYLSKRKKLQENVSLNLVAPYKVERIPHTLDISSFIQEIRKMPSQTVIFNRNRLLCWVLAETGCQVSELVRIRRSHIFLSSEKKQSRTGILFYSSNGDERRVFISEELYAAIRSLKLPRTEKDPFLFYGFNRYGPISSHMSERAVELLLKQTGKQLKEEKLTPRLIRHSVIVYWLKNGWTKSEVKTAVGLKTDYVFKVYDPIVKSNRESTSTL